MVSCPFLNVRPIQFHFRLLICVDISVSSALLQSSLFQITSGQWIFKILRRQRLTNTCSFEIVVFATFHASEPHSNTDFTARLYNSYKNITCKLLRTNAAIWFNKMCKIKQVKPNYINIKINNNKQNSRHTHATDDTDIRPHTVKEHNECTSTEFNLVMA
jgi:hypothetical protein